MNKLMQANIEFSLGTQFQLFYSYNKIKTIT